MGLVARRYTQREPVKRKSCARKRDIVAARDQSLLWASVRAHPLSSGRLVLLADEHPQHSPVGVE